MTRWFRSGLSVSGPFVRRCLIIHSVLPSSHPAHRTGHAPLAHPALGQSIHAFAHGRLCGSLAVLPRGLVQALGPVLEQIAEMTKKIKHYDRLIKGLTETEYPETQALIQVYGVGQLTALTYVLTLGSKERFQRSRDVGCYLGLRPKRSQSGDRDPQLGITKAGNIYLRTLLVECANHVLGPHGRDSTSRQWGLHLASRGGKQSRNRAIVAVARKLAVLLHRIWITQEPYIPFYGVAA